MRSGVWQPQLGSIALDDVSELVRTYEVPFLLRYACSAYLHVPYRTMGIRTSDGSSDVLTLLISRTFMT